MSTDEDEPIIRAEDLAVSLLATEVWLEDRGWDHSPLVLALQMDGSTDPDDEWADDEWDDESDDLVYAVVGEGDAFALLDELDASEEIALVVATEADDVRTVTAVTAEGYVACVTRQRGEEPSVALGGDPRLVDAMTAALHPTEPADDPDDHRGDNRGNGKKGRH